MLAPAEKNLPPNAAVSLSGTLLIELIIEFTPLDVWARRLLNMEENRPLSKPPVGNSAPSMSEGSCEILNTISFIPVVVCVERFDHAEENIQQLSRLMEVLR